MPARLPFEPIEKLIGASALLQYEVNSGYHSDLEEFRPMSAALAARLGVERKRIPVYRREGIPLRSADRIATHLGHHPTTIWPDFDEVCEAAARG